MSIQFNPNPLPANFLGVPSRESIYSSLTQNADENSIGCCEAILACLMELWNALIAFLTCNSGETEALATLLNKADRTLNPNTPFHERETAVDQAIKLIREGSPVTEEMFWQMIRCYTQDRWSDIFPVACEKLQPTKEMLNEGFKKAINYLVDFQEQKYQELASFLLEKGAVPIEILDQDPDVIQNMIIYSDWIEDCFKTFFSRIDQKNKDITLTLAVKDQMAIVDTGMPMSFHAAATLIELGQTQIHLLKSRENFIEWSLGSTIINIVKRCRYVHLPKSRTVYLFFRISNKTGEDSSKSIFSAVFFKSTCRC